jgi:hypothetical protein
MGFLQKIEDRLKNIDVYKHVADLDQSVSKAIFGRDVDRGA